MKTAIVIGLTVMLFLFTMLSASAGQVLKRAELWTSMCESCHNGKTAPDAGWMREQFKNSDEFVAAVKGRGNRCMNIMKHDESLARKIAAEIGISDGKGK